MKTATINSGSFSEKGNFTGYSDNVEDGRLFIHAKQMESAGFSKDKEIKYPFYVSVTTRTINPFDENGEPLTNEDGSLKEVQRVQAGSVFATRERLVQALAEPQLINLEVAKLVNATASTAGISEKQMQSLLGNILV